MIRLGDALLDEIFRCAQNDGRKNSDAFASIGYGRRQLARR